MFHSDQHYVGKNKTVEINTENEVIIYSCVMQPIKFGAIINQFRFAEHVGQFLCWRPHAGAICRVPLSQSIVLSLNRHCHGYCGCNASKAASQEKTFDTAVME